LWEKSQAFVFVLLDKQKDISQEVDHARLRNEAKMQLKLPNLG